MKKKLELLEVDVVVPWEGSVQPMSMIMAMTTEDKPIYSLKPKKLLKLDLDRDIDPTTARNLI
jgi:hypothetical protein